jgi:hypothetical protein
LTYLSSSSLFWNIRPPWLRHVCSRKNLRAERPERRCAGRCPQRMHVQFLDRIRFVSGM